MWQFELQSSLFYLSVPRLAANPFFFRKGLFPASKARNIRSVCVSVHILHARGMPAALSLRSKWYRPQDRERVHSVFTCCRRSAGCRRRWTTPLTAAVWGKQVTDTEGRSENEITGRGRGFRILQLCPLSLQLLVILPYPSNLTPQVSTHFPAKVSFGLFQTCLGVLSLLHPQGPYPVWF